MKWVRQETQFQIGQSVKVERLEEVVPAVVLETGDANLYLLMPLHGPPMFWAFEANMSPLSDEEQQSLNCSRPHPSKKFIITHF